MRFKEYINNEKTYKELCKYGHGTLHKSFKGQSNYLLNQEEKEDILAEVFEALSIKNDEITNVDSFKRGHFINYVWNKGTNYLNNKHKKKLFYPKAINTDIKWKIYEESKEILSKIKDRKLKAILEDKFYNGLEFKDLQKKYNIANMNTVYKQAKIEIMGKEARSEANYVGVARMLKGKIDKLYPSVSSVKADKFDKSRVCAICNGTYKGQHKGFDWVYVKNLKISYENNN